MHDKDLSRSGKQAESFLLAEGLENGKVVATHKVEPARRPTKLILWADTENVEMTADGSDLVTVVAAVADGKGNIKRLNNYWVKFEFEGPGELVASESTFTNPRPVQWGDGPRACSGFNPRGTDKSKGVRRIPGQAYAAFGRTCYPNPSVGTSADS